MNRRDFIVSTGALASAAVLPAQSQSLSPRTDPQPVGRKFKLGTITYNIGATWDLPTLLSVCKTTRFDYVELRTTHAHKVEPTLTREQRRDVKRQFDEAAITLWSFGTICEFQSPDPATVRAQVESCKAFCQLAADMGAKGVKVRPNGLPKQVETEKTLEQIGRTLRECGKAAGDLGLEIWVEVHGTGTQNPPNMRRIMDHCGHPKVGVCWNSNPTDVKDGSIKESFDLLKKDIRSCHINELWSDYPYRDLFAGLKFIGYDRITFMEVPGVPEAADAKEPSAAIRFMRYYKALWTELAGS